MVLVSYTNRARYRNNAIKQFEKQIKCNTNTS